MDSVLIDPKPAAERLNRTEISFGRWKPGTGQTSGRSGVTYHRMDDRSLN